MAGNKKFNHRSGMLMPVSALPSRYGIGSFGRSAYEFVDMLGRCGVRCWQVLPLNPTSYGDSPYQSPASVAGNPYFIDLDILYSKGLLTRGELRENRNDSPRIDYGWLFETRYKLLKRAYARFVEGGGARGRGYKSFLKREKHWLDDYSLFMALKERFNYRPFTEWDEKYRNVNRARLVGDELARERGFYEWVQYEFYTEWRELVLYAHEHGVMIIGDMPIYVAHDSMDVWRAPEQFLLDEELMPVMVAGCPPDDFSPEGQLWGNPIYNWEMMETDGFSWWISRVRSAMRLYDVIRIDHFRGFAGYYSIPYGDTDATRGSWEGAPGLKLFETIKRELPSAWIIAEDLGHITPDVRELLEATGFAGMKMLQFAFYEDDNEYLPRMYKSDNCIVYTGSHDSDLTRSFVSSLEGEARRRLHRELSGSKGRTTTEKLIDLAMNSRADLVVIPIQDWLEMRNEEGRINIPSISTGNWTFRLKKRRLTERLEDKIFNLTYGNGR